MPIVKTFDLNDFRNEFMHYGRGNQFSYDGLEALFDYFDELYSDDNWEMDVIAICCDFTEYESLEDFKKDYGDEYESIEDIESDTFVLRDYDGDSFIIQNF